MESTLVIGFGNTLLGDDGVGILAIRRLRQEGSFCSKVSFLEMEAAMVNVLDHLEGVDRLLVVDSIQTVGGTPGTITRMTLNDLAEAKGDTLSTHQMGLSRVLGLAESLGFTHGCPVTICALEIAQPPDFADHPSDMVMRKMPELLQLITSTIHENSKEGPAYGKHETRLDRP